MVNRPDSKKARDRRHKRVRGKISGTAACPRLSVYRSLSNISAQTDRRQNGSHAGCRFVVWKGL